MAATERLQFAGNIIRGANAFALLPDRTRFDAEAWEYEIRDWGWLGRAITILALMFGAQFWFDVLRRLVGVRKTFGSGGSSAG